MVMASWDHDTAETWDAGAVESAPLSVRGWFDGFVNRLTHAFTQGGNAYTGSVLGVGVASSVGMHLGR